MLEADPLGRKSGVLSMEVDQFHVERLPGCLRLAPDKLIGCLGLGIRYYTHVFTLFAYSTT